MKFVYFNKLFIFKLNLRTFYKQLFIKNFKNREFLTKKKIKSFKLYTLIKFYFYFQVLSTFNLQLILKKFQHNVNQKLKALFN